MNIKYAILEVFLLICLGLDAVITNFTHAIFGEVFVMDIMLSIITVLLIMMIIVVGINCFRKDSFQ